MLRCSRGERPLVELYLEPVDFSGRCTGESLPLRVDLIHRVEFEGVSGHRVGFTSRGDRETFGMWNHPRGHVWNFVVRPGLKLRCDRKVGNPFQTKQGSRPYCPDQEGRRGSEEVVPENLGVPLEGDRYVGEVCGSH